MTKSELIDALALEQTQLSYQDVEFAVNEVLEKMTRTLATKGRIEIRGFGSFSLHHRAARTGRNPKTGEKVYVPSKYVPHFKPGKALREQVDKG